jgi:Protein of unknown function (DUF2924)
MQASSKRSGRPPKNSAAADLDEAAGGMCGGLALRGGESARESSDAESAVRARTAAAADGNSPLADRLAVLPTLGVGDLRLEWRRLFRAEPPRLSRDIMTRAIAYRLQEITQGGLSKVTQRRLMTLANQLETDGRIAPLPGPRIKPGSRLVREWRARTHTVSVTDDGFEFQGKTYRSLTKIAFDITGAKWSGPRFFGLTQRPKSVASSETTVASKTVSDDVKTDADSSELESESSNG